VSRVTPTISPLIDVPHIRSIEPLVHPSDFKNCIKQYVVLLFVGNDGGYFIATRQLQMYPVVEIGRPRDKKDPACYFKSSILFSFQSGSWGREYWVFREAFISATESACTANMQDYA
jgi:hypothetical protein